MSSRYFQVVRAFVRNFAWIVLRPTMGCAAPRTGSVLVALLAASLLAPARPGVAQSPPTAADALLPSQGYYVVTGIDPRMCPSPVCGGVFVKLVNRRLTPCADGTLAEQCHAPLLDWSALGLSEEETFAVEDDFRRERLLARGELRLVETPYGPLATLVAMDAWRGETGNAATKRFYGLRPSGIVCITAPCPSLIASRLNQRGRHLVHEVDLASSGATPQQVEAGYVALFQGAGLLVAGDRVRVTGPAGRGTKIVAQEFYTQVVAETAAK